MIGIEKNICILYNHKSILKKGAKMSETRFFTALREEAKKRLEHMGYADIVVGIPCINSMESVSYVAQNVLEGLEKYYPDKRALVFISDGGSTDDTREVSREVHADSYNTQILVSIYRGISGKGSAFRAIFEAARFLKADAVAVFDSDLKSITPEWVKGVLTPVFEGYDYVAPDYLRFKFDGTITNTITYNLIRALYGRNIRQPIGGDFGISTNLVKHYLDMEVWETDIARFGIDIWMTVTAIEGDFKICQARLGAKIHGEKDPASDLSPMFRQVVGTIFTLMELNDEHWIKDGNSVNIPTFGEFDEIEPAPFNINHEALIDYFKLGFTNFHGTWERIIDPEDYKVIEALAKEEDLSSFQLPTDTWVRIVYHYAVAFHLTPRMRFKVLDTLIPIYNAKVASLVNNLRDISTKEAENYYEEQAKEFERLKPYLIKLWEESKGEEKSGIEKIGDYFTRLWN